MSTGNKGDPMDEEDISEMENGFRIIGVPLFEEEGEAKTTKAFKKLEENRAKKPWEQVDYRTRIEKLLTLNPVYIRLILSLTGGFR